MHTAAKAVTWAKSWSRGGWSRGNWGTDTTWGGWGDWLGGSGATGPQFSDAPMVQILLSNGSWLDISTDVRYTAFTNMTTGRRAGDTRVRAGSAGPIQINNLDGKYSPRNPNSPLFGLIGRNTQIRFSRRGTLRFWGEIPEWPPEWVEGGQDAWVTVTAAGILRHVLAGNAPLLQSALTRSQVAANPAIGWTLEDASSAIVGAPLHAGDPTMIPFGPIGFGGVTDLGGALASPNMGSAGILIGANVLPATPITGSWGVEWAAKATESQSNAMVDVVDNAGNSFYVLTPWTLPTFPMALNVVNPTTGAIFNTSSTLFSSDGVFNNSWHYYAMYFQQSGSNITAQLYVDGVLAVSGNTSITGVNFTLGAPHTIQGPTDISGFKTAGPDGSLKSISHVSFFAGTTPSLIYAALTGYTGETAARRIQRLLGENSLGSVIIGDPDDSMQMGAQGVDKLVDLLYDCETADMGYLFEDRNTFSMGYRTRASIQNQPPKLWMNYQASGNVVNPIKPADNDQRIINDSTVQRKGGGSVRATLTSGPMSTAPVSQGGIGTYPETPTVNVFTDLQAGDVAGWHVNVGTVDEQRYDQINVNVANTLYNHGLTGLADQMCNVITGDMIQIDNPPVWAQMDSIKTVHVGQTEFFNQFLHTITYDTVQYTPYVMGILDDLILGRFESDSTTVQTGIDAVTTTFLGLTATGELWITTALNAADFSFDVMVLTTGERLTVSDITGTGNPQTWTVTRSVNGVVKPIPAGAVIKVRNPFRLAA